MNDPLTHLEQFSADLHQEVLVKCSDDGSPQMREDAFVETVLERLTAHGELDDWDICYHEAKSHGRLPAAKMNGWSLSGDGATLDLFVCKYSGGEQPESVTRAEVEQHFKLARGFLRRSLDGVHKLLEESQDVFEAARRIHEAGDNLTTVRLFFLTDGVVKSADIEQEQLPGIELRYVLWDLEKLSRIQVGERVAIELDFVKQYGGPVPCIETADATGEYRTFLAFLPATLLARIYGEHGQRLLERNVRAFLQAKGKVNKGLQQTLREQPHRFLAYNNGLCCTAADVDVDAGKDGHARLRIVRDFQIVNGGQTTASIYHALKKEKTDVSQVVVQVKLTVLNDPAKVADIVPLISRYANSQNKVNTADFSANGTFHQELEHLSRAIWAPAASGLERGTHWYYERARGSYLDDKAREGTPAKMRDWERQNPPTQKFTKTDLAKYEHAWSGLPHLVCRGAEKNFIEFAQRQEEEGAPIVDRNFFHHFVAKTILFRTTEKLVSAQEFGGWRANIVAYTIAWLAEKSGRRIDLNRVWDEQHLTPALCEAITAVCKEANSHVTSQSGNVGEATKRAECWEAFRGRKITIPVEWEVEWAGTEFVAPSSIDDILEAEWEKVREQFRDDPRTIEGLEAYTGKIWVPARRRDPVSAYAVLTWHQLRMKPGLGPKKVRLLVEMFSAAA